MDTISNEQNQGNKETQSENEKVKSKVKRARTEKQIEAFKRCAEKRKQNLQLKAQVQPQANVNTNSTKSTSAETGNVNSNSISNPISNEDVRNMLSVFSMFKTHLENIKVQSKEKDKDKTQGIMTGADLTDQNRNKMVSFNNSDGDGDDVGQQKQKQMNVGMNSMDTTMMDVDLNLDADVTQSERIPVSRQPVSREYGYGYPNQQHNNPRKRDIYSVNPYEDERRSMIEKIYARNMNLERQSRMDIEDRERQNIASMNDNSIQIIPPRNLNSNPNGTNTNTSSYTNGDERGRIVSHAEAVASMIKTGSMTPSARRNATVAVNGLRVASRR